MTQIRPPKARELLSNCQALCTRLAAFGTDLTFTPEEETNLLGFKQVVDAHLVRATFEDAGLTQTDTHNLWRAYKAYERQQSQNSAHANDQRDKTNARRRATNY